MSADLLYPGTRPFRRDDSGRFFGRTNEAAELSQLWLRHRLTFLSGPAGIGKTSLLAAGVLPLVSGNNVELLPVGGFSRGSSTPVTPPGQYTPYTLALLRSWSLGSSTPELAPFTVDEFIARQARMHDPAIALLAAIDQADDLFAGPPSRQPQRQRFLRELADALEHPSLRLLICVRDEALLQFTEVIGHGAHLQLTELELDQAYQAVEGPGYFASDAARDLVQAVRTSSIVDAEGNARQVIPDRVQPALLQVACARLWELLSARSSSATSRELRRYGDIDGILATYCGQAIATVARVFDVPMPRLRLLLTTKFVAAIGGSQDVTEAQVRDFGLPSTIARAFEDLHLLRARAGAAVGSRVYRLINDRVIEPIKRFSEDVRPDEDAGVYLSAAERALTTGEIDLAERYAELASLTASETDLVLHGNARSLMGNVARERNELEQAEAHYRAALGLFEAAMEYTMVSLLLAAIGRMLIARGQLEAGLSELRSAVLRRPADTTIQAEFSAAVQELTWRLDREGAPRISPG